MTDTMAENCEIAHGEWAIIDGANYCPGCGTELEEPDEDRKDELTQRVADVVQEEGPQYVVYTLDEDGNPAHFLSVEESAEAATETMDRWWHAFRNDEKAAPNKYDGISFRPVSGFDKWKAPGE